ncbi:hypothetical protein HPP92_010671 [Vanilla planifolia]|uniref:Uncharacterized protein n=1 Tax=Vanilla planifolia TaxID=51239 RepID=A0A835V004_VANPL|nr:hypothetical protein HPP92_010671 [Vanilla planifolia]
MTKETQKDDGECMVVDPPQPHQVPPSMEICSNPCDHDPSMSSSCAEKENAALTHDGEVKESSGGGEEISHDELGASLEELEKLVDWDLEEIAQRLWEEEETEKVWPCLWEEEQSLEFGGFSAMESLGGIEDHCLMAGFSRICSDMVYTAEPLQGF